MEMWWFEDEDVYEKGMAQVEKTIGEGLFGEEGYAQGGTLEAQLAATIDERVEQTLQSLFAAALADPDIDEAAKSFAGWALEHVSPAGGFGDEDD
jgi:hypothetical protein